MKLTVILKEIACVVKGMFDMMAELVTSKEYWLFVAIWESVPVLLLVFGQTKNWEAIDNIMVFGMPVIVLVAVPLLVLLIAFTVAMVVEIKYQIRKTKGAYNQ